VAWWHASSYQMMGIRSSWDSHAAASMDALERWSGFHVPAAVREWHVVPGAAAWLARRRGNVAVASGRLGAPVGGIDYLARGLLVTETDGQNCCRWVVRLRPLPPRYEPEPLFDLPEAATTIAAVEDDPPVWIVDPDDVESPPRRTRRCWPATRERLRATLAVPTPARIRPPSRSPGPQLARTS
jgi:hypothetical protein